MKPIVSSIISISLLISFVSLFLSYRVSAVFFLFIIFTSVISIIIFRKSIKENQNKNLYYLVFISISAIIILAMLANIKVDKERILAKQAYQANNPISQNSNQNQDLQNKNQNIDLNINSSNIESILVADKSRVDIDIFMRILKSKIDNRSGSDKNNSEQDILEYFLLVEKLAAEKVSVRNPDTYTDMGKIYEAAYAAELTQNTNLAISNYKEYIKLKPKDPVGYATMAKFLALDTSFKSFSKKEVTNYAQKAYDLARSQAEKDEYKNLLSYIKSL